MTTRADLEAATWVRGIALVPKPPKDIIMDDEDEVKRYDKMVTRMHEEDDKTIYDIADDLKADRDMLASNLSSCVEVLEKTKVIVDRLRGKLTRLTADRMDLDNARALFENCRRLQEENERLRGLLREVIDGTACDEYSVTWEWLERACTDAAWVKP